MSYSLHYAKTYKADWDGGAFSHTSDEWGELFEARFSDNGWSSESEEEYEVNATDLQAYVNELTAKPDELNEYFTECTNQEVADELQDMLNGYDKDNDYIRLAWY